MGEVSFNISIEGFLAVVAVVSIFIMAISGAVRTYLTWKRGH